MSLQIIETIVDLIEMGATRPEDTVKLLRQAIKSTEAVPWPDITKQRRESYQKGHNDGVAHHKQAVKRAWVKLTDEQILVIEETTTCTGNESWLRKLARNIEAKSKELNHEQTN